MFLPFVTAPFLLHSRTKFLNHDFHLDIECAGDQKLPYSGCVNVDIGMAGVVDPTICLLLVTPDTRFGLKVPVILGTNVLKPLLNAAQQLHGTRFQQYVRMRDALYFAFQCMILQNRLQNKSSGRLAVVKSAASRKIFVPENTTMIIEGKFDKKQFTHDQMDMMQPLSQSILPEGVCVTPTVVDSRQDSIPIELSNLIARPIVIVSDSILYQVQSCKIESTFYKPFHIGSSLSKLSIPALSLVDFNHSELTDPELS